ncbi:MAG: hypothetical protein WAT61_00920, partial [Flavobacteriales bacterium]
PVPTITPSARRLSTKPQRMAHATLRKASRKRMEMPAQQGPREATIKSILSYSKALKVVTVPPVGQVDIVLN